MSKPILKGYRSDIARCVRCGACRAVCASFLAEREESMSARGRMALIEAVVDGRLRVSEIYKDRLATCFGCLACEASCPSGVPAAEIIKAAKKEAFRESGPGVVGGLISAALRSDSAKKSLAWLAPLLLHYAGSSVKGYGRRLWNARDRDNIGQAPIGARNKKEKGSKGKIAFFPGCAIDLFQRDIGASAVAVLARLGYDVFVPEGWCCCGRPHLSIGDERSAALLAGRNRKAMSVTGVEAIVTACASCGLTFKKEYPTLLPPSNVMPPVLDINEFLADRLSGVPFKAVKIRVTYHDPCHLRRGQGISGEARSVLKSIPGLELVEMKHPDRCCGFGGVMRATHRRLSDRIGDEKAADIISTGASWTATGCPGCRMQIADALRTAGSEVRVVHTVQVLDMAAAEGRDKR